MGGLRGLWISMLHAEAIVNHSFQLHFNNQTLDKTEWHAINTAGKGENLNTNGQAEGFVNFCASCRGHCKLLKNFEPSPLSVSLNWAIIPDKLGSSVPHITENTTTDSMQYDNEKGLSGNHYSTKLNHIIWNPANGNSESGNQSALLAMLGSRK